jgi:hypothetical protein
VKKYKVKATDISRRTKGDSVTFYIELEEASDAISVAVEKGMEMFDTDYSHDVKVSVVEVPESK